MTTDEVPLNKSDKAKKKVQGNEANNDLAAKPLEETKEEEPQEEYYEKGNGGATD